MESEIQKDPNDESTFRSSQFDSRGASSKVKLCLTTMSHLRLPPLQPVSQEKIHRELFVGNTPPETSELLLLHFINAAMRRVKLCQPHESPVINVRVQSKFAFVELGTAEQANQCLHLNGIPFLQAHLKISRPSKYNNPAGLPAPHQNWQSLTGQDTSKVPDPETEKLRRELFIGNTTPEMTSSMLTEFLGRSMEQVRLTLAPGNPITACRVSGKFAFVELRSAPEAAAALNLNGIPFLGTALRVGRPSKYQGPPDRHGNWEDIISKVLAGELDTNTGGDGGGGGKPTSKVVELQQMLSLDDLKDPEEYADILEDTKEQCSEFGNLVQVVIPKAGEPGATKIFLEYGSESDAAAAIQALEGRTFDGRLVEANYFEEEKFRRRQFA